MTTTINEKTYEYRGLSTDVKPMEKAGNGSVFIEMDTGKVYIFDEENLIWIELSKKSGDSDTGSGESGGGANITSNIKIVANKNDILGTTEHNKLCILSDTSELSFKVVDKIDGVKGEHENISTLSEVLPDATNYAFCARYEDNIYIFGGANNSSTNKNNRTDIIYKFNCKTKTIETLSTRLPQILTEACCATYNDNIYIFGGASTSVVNTIYKFNCTTETIETLSVTLPNVRYGACCATYGDNIYIFGGNDGSYVYNNIYKFNCKTETISTLSITLPAYLYYMCCSIYNSSIYIFGGISSYHSKAIYKFNCKTETIETLSVTLPVTLYASSCSIFDDVIYILGGNNGNAVVNTIYKFNCTTESIETLSVTLPQPVSISFCCSICENNIYLFGGHNGNKRLDTIYNLSVSFELIANNVLIYNANSNYSFDLITDQVTIPIKNIYIGNSNNKAQLANAYLYDDSQSAWVNVNTGEVLS